MTMILDQFSLAGRIAVVTGASRGIGRALSLGLAAAGATVIVTGREPATLEAARDAILEAGGIADLEAFDVASVAAIKAGFAAIEARHGRVDILINNAGMEQVRPALDIDEELWDRILDTNLKGAFFCAQAAARLMPKGGAIVNLCSLTSEIGIPTAVPYGASKTGLVGMTRALSAEWAARGIRVNGIGPGYFRTELTEAFYQDTAWQDAMLAKIPLKRFGKLEDLIGAAVFLASPASAYVTGQILYVDGGFLASI
jgi:NAD(P)-dependent dehydrogenase (short-subunit alcohol dehydrogenase family)